DRIVATGSRGFGAPPSPTVQAVEVRFYAVDGDRPGAVVAEYVLAGDDPNLVYDPVGVNTFDITLSPPFQATGHHFVGVQVVMESYWERPSSGNGTARLSHIWVKDDLGSGQWEPYSDVLGQHFDDIAFELHGTLDAAPQITGLSSPTATRSGRLRIFGSNFGGTADGGQVAIDGRPAIGAEWPDLAIHAYVPEAASLGVVDVVVSTATGGAGAPFPVEVTERIPSGRVNWRFTCDGRGVRHRVGIGPDGTIYAQDTDGLLYALGSDGALLWITDTGGQGGEGPVVVGSDGTVYVGANPLGPTADIVALNPDGSIRWRFSDTDTQGLLAGPGIGPDGRVYAVTEQPGLGAFALDPATGDLEWSNPGSPPVNEHGQLGIEIAFGQDRFYVAFDERAHSPIALIYGFSLDGAQLFAVGRPDGNAEAEVGPAGDFYLPVWGSASGIGLGAYDPDGVLQWTALDSLTNVLTNPSVGPDGSIYTSRNLRELWSIHPDGSTRWSVTDADVLDSPEVSPDGGTLLVGGRVGGSHGFVRAFDAADGTRLWEELIPPELGYGVTPSARPLFSADGSLAVVPVEPGANPDDNLHCYVYAFDVSRRDSSELFSDGFETGGTQAWSGTR
ncbi:MAG TPA: PQQ-binding-like beta-propeller repeat protein, partial [Candidatus Sulfomarinibacteraceae bacterium]|nr:PQQ-binding-like beta-propeller repeat protein [Candidatus Sulfomarinibacteraceae bacterium]